MYYLPKPVPDGSLALMRRIDGLHLELPFAGNRMLRDLLCAEGFMAGRRRVRRLMKKMGIEVLYRHLNSSRPQSGNRIYPYLLRGLKIECANHIWSTDLTYIPMARGFVYLVVIMDWASRRVLAHRRSISMDGKGHWVDNVFVERLWRSVKYEHVYLHAHESVSDARAAIAQYLEFFNSKRPHSALGGRTPDTAYFLNETMKQTA